MKRLRRGLLLALICAAPPLCELLLRWSYGYGLFTFHYLALAALLMLCHVGALAAIVAGLVVGIVKRSKASRYVWLYPVAGVLGIALAVLALSSIQETMTKGARCRINALGGETFVSSVRADASALLAQYPSDADEILSGGDANVPKSFEQLGAYIVRIERDGELTYISIASSAPHRSRWNVVPAGSTTTREPPGLKIAEGLYRD